MNKQKIYQYPKINFKKLKANNKYKNKICRQKYKYNLQINNNNNNNNNNKFKININKIQKQNL